MKKRKILSVDEEVDDEVKKLLKEKFGGKNE